VHDTSFCKIGCESVLDSFASVFLSAISMEKFQLVSTLSFDHGEPKFEDFEDGVGLLVGDSVHPGVVGGEVVKCEYILRIAERCWINLAANI
jgi:hypothetical protein